MGGRGSSSGASGGGARNVAKLSENIIQNPNSALSQLSQYSGQMDIKQATFTANGNSVKFQSATLGSGGDRIDLAFSTDYNPQQVTKPTSNIKTEITATIWKNGNAQSHKVLATSKTKSLKNAQNQYDSMLSEWKKATGQKQIRFK